jgi:acyl CoA:acetate/3-ketoacid CoA transferase alpha subunit
MKQPDAKLHQIISFIKSGIRILGYGFLLFNLPVAIILLILSEGIGIIEELV